MSYPLLYFPGKSQAAGFKNKLVPARMREVSLQGETAHWPRVSLHSKQSHFLGSKGGEEGRREVGDDAYSLPSCASPTGATSKPIFTGKITNGPTCDFAWVRRLNPSARCPNVNNCQNLKCSRMESGSMLSLFPPPFFVNSFPFWSTKLKRPAPAVWWVFCGLQCSKGAVKCGVKESVPLKAFRFPCIHIIFMRAKSFPGLGLHL